MKQQLIRMPENLPVLIDLFVSVPVDLEVRCKAILLGATFLIVSIMPYSRVYWWLRVY
jgi:hypothetical protein